MAEFRWFGHNCFRIRAREATILTDPVGKPTGYALPKQSADLITISHDHPGHANLAAVKPDFHSVTGPGEYEIHGVFITGIRTYHDAVRGAERGYNTVYIMEVEGMVICHLGDLGHPMTDDQAEAMTNVDVLLVPAGGGTVIDQERAAEVVAQLQPKIVIPMQFATPKGDRTLGDVTDFCRHLGVATPPGEEKLTLRHSDLPEQMKVIVLTPES
ncbi:MAG TPA: MBL fold metallo-hydrolase [Thermomicrobiales bacterium]|nr:MBL fold metallo-hydrolase [Thermomicrobiales bacterium]